MKLLLQFLVTVLIFIASATAIYYLGDLLSKSQPFYIAFPLIMLLLGIVLLIVVSVISFFNDLYKNFKQ